jgi:sulfide:quinone oxidoreductase
MPSGAGERLRVLIAGAGVAGLEAMLALRAVAEERVEIELLAPEDEFSYRPLTVREPFGAPAPERFPLASLLERESVRFRRGFLVSVDADAGTARTGDGENLAYDALVIACGGRHVESISGAVTFPGLGDVEDMRGLLAELRGGGIRRLVFALPPDAGWPLPLYELTLLTAAWLRSERVGETSIALVTPESAPLDVFGDVASDAVRRLLEESGVELLSDTYPVALEGGRLAVRPGGSVAADRVVALPRLEGPAIPGLPHDANGFLQTDLHGTVMGVDGVHAAGDAVAFPVKQGGIASQQADAVAEVIAARAGAPVTPAPFRPVLRGLLLTGGAPRFLRSDLTSGHGDTSETSLDALWWPPGKIAGRYLGPYLAEAVGLAAGEPPPGEAVAVDVEL